MADDLRMFVDGEWVPARMATSSTPRERGATGRDAAVAIVTTSPYGLLRPCSPGTWRGLRYAEGVRAGWVNVNEGTNYWEPHLPFGERFTELKTIVMRLR
jgi:hypothetical protein